MEVCVTNFSGFSFASMIELRRSTKYKKYINEMGDKYIICDKESDYYSNPKNYYPEILFDIVALAERFPNTTFKEWSDEDQEKGFNEALFFYNKYGHLDISEFLDASYSLPAYTLNENRNEEFFHPIKEEIESYNEYKRIRYQKIKKTNMDEYLRLSREKDNMPIPQLTYGEPVWVFYDMIWYISGLLNFWNRIKTIKPEKNERYIPSKNDNIQRLLKYFSLGHHILLVTKINSEFFYFEDDNSTLVEDVVEHGKFYYRYPRWGELTYFYQNYVFMNAEIKLTEDYTSVLSFSTISLLESILFFALLDINKGKNREIKYCKNCNELIFSNNPKAVYCSKNCGTQFNTRMWRLREAEKNKI